MFDQKQLATATLAQIFGSDLLRVDQSTIENPGTRAVRLDPKQFLTGQSQNAAKRKEEAALIAKLQREAESAYPLPQQPVSEPPQQSLQAPVQLAQEPATLTASHQIAVKPSSLVLGSGPVDIGTAICQLAESLNNIAIALGNVDVPKKKRKVVKTKPTK